MTYLLIFFVIAVALAPLSHFVPSKRQREIARMREYAAVHGLFVEFRRLPGSASGRSSAAGSKVRAPHDPVGRDIIYYGKRLPPARNKGERRQAWLCDGQEWRSLEQRAVLPAPLEVLGVPALAASVDENSCGVYWSEAGGEEPVELIRRCLEDWSAQLRP